MTDGMPALAAELCIGTVRRLRFLTGSLDGSIPLIPAGDFECAMRVPWTLGVAVNTETGSYCPASSEGSGLPSCIAPDADETIREKLALGVPPSAPSIDVILEGYLGVATNYGEPSEWLPDTREPFRVPEQYQREIDALARAGYLEWRGRNMMWSDLAKPAMLAAYCWVDDGN